MRATAPFVVLVALAVTNAGMGAAPSATPLLDWQFDGEVRSVARVGDTLFVAGQFTNAAPASGAAGSFYALSPTTGAVVSSGVPALNEAVTAMVSDGSGGYYLAGAFTNVGPATPSPTRVVRIGSSGTVDPAFQMPAAVSGNVMSMVRVGPSLVLGGFLRVNGVDRPLAALDPVSGALSPWNPVLPTGDNGVWDMDAAGDVVFVLSGAYFGPTRYVTAFDGFTGAQVWQTDVTGAPGFLGVGRLAVAGGRLIVGLGRLYSLDPTTGVVDPTWAAGQAPTAGVFGLAVNGGTIYVSGLFTVFHGQPRTRLAAVDLSTGNLLPWAPQASDAIAAIAASPTGGVFLGVPYGPTSPPTVNGVTRAGIWEIDAAGAVTSFVAEAVAPTVSLLERATNGNVLVSGATAFAGKVPRAGLAAVDVNTGALLPAAITVTAAAGSPSVRNLVAHGGTLYLAGVFDSVNGQARPGVAAVDVATSTVLAWQPTGVTAFSLDFADHGWIYVTASGGTFPRRRVDAATGAVDPVWQPTDVLSLQLVGGELMTWGRITSSGCNTGSVLGTLDPVTGAFREWFRTSAFNSATITRDGDTVYLAGALPNFQPGGCYAGSGLFAYDRRTGTRVDAPPLVGAINSLTTGDGRLLAAGGAMAMGAAPVTGLVELLRPGGTGFAQSGVLTASVHGDLIVAVAGSATAAGGIMRVVGYGLTGTSVPSNLRSQSAGADTLFTWDAMVPPPAGGYVIEGGFAPGQAVGALLVGNATSVALPMPAGPVFIRVRPQGSTEVSNEIVAGCVAPPLPPTALTTTLNGINLTLAWTAPAGSVTGYTLRAGTASGLSNAATLALGPQTSVSGPVPGGTFFARVTASNACGTSAPSGEVFFTIGAPDALPAAPTNLMSSVNGSTLTLSWSAAAGAVTGYVLEAGSAPGLADIGAATIGAGPSFVIPGVPAGVYYVRVRAVTSAGSGAPSSDVVVVVP